MWHNICDRGGSFHFPGRRADFADTLAVDCFDQPLYRPTYTKQM